MLYNGYEYIGINVQGAVMKELGRALGLISQLGISMLVPILICLAVGVFIDKAVGTSPVFMIIFIIAGVMAGFRSVYMLTLEYHKDKDDPYYYKKKDKS